MNFDSYLESATTAFKNKQYLECFQTLKSNIKTFGPGHFTTLWQGFKVENVIIIAEFMWKSSIRGHIEPLLCRETEQKFDALLQKTRSAPASRDCLSTELVVLYNWLYQKCLQNFSKDPAIHTLKKDVVDAFLHSMVRVQKFLKADFTQTHNLHKSSSDFVLEVIELCCPKFAECPEEELATAFILVCCLWSAIQLHDGKTSDASYCLQSLRNNLNLKVKCDKEVGLVLPVGPVVIGCYDGHFQQSLRLSDVVDFLLAVCMYADREYKSCRRHIEAVEFKPWTVYSKYLAGVTMYKEKNYAGVIGMLESAKGDNCTDIQLKAMTANLVGSCIAKLGHPHSAIQKYREATELDFTFLLPVYNISLQYNNLQLYDAELESLNLLVTALESHSMKSSDPGGRDRSLVFGLLGYTDTITFLQAMYSLARRCLELKRYDVASEKYLDVLSHIDECGFQQNENDVIFLPPLQKIYYETLYALLCAGKYDNCIIVSDRLIACQSDINPERVCENNEFSIIDLDPASPSQSTFCGSRKRQRSETCLSSFMNTQSSTGTDESGPLPLDEMGNDVTALVYKGDALVQLRRYKEAADCLHRAVEILQLSSPAIVRVATANKSISIEPKSKRQRLDSGKCLGKENDTCVSHLTVDGSLLAEVLERLAISLAVQAKYCQALHFLRLSLQLDPENLKAMYNITLVLWKLDRQNEAALGWAEFQKIQVKSDSFQLGNELRIKQNKLKLLCNEEDSVDELVVTDVSDERVLQLDIACIEYLIKFRRGLCFK